jgi:hypothetical protein
MVIKKDGIEILDDSLTTKKRTQISTKEMFEQIEKESLNSKLKAFRQESTFKKKKQVRTKKGSFKSIPEKELNVQILFNLLDTVEIGETIPYEELSEAIGKKVNYQNGVPGPAYWTLNKAVNRILNQKQKVFEAVQKVGMKYLTDSEVVTTVGERAIRRTRKFINKSVKRIITVDFDNLSNSDKIKHNTDLSVINVIKVITSRDKINKIEIAVLNNSGLRLPYSEMIETYLEDVKS